VVKVLDERAGCYLVMTRDGGIEWMHLSAKDELVVKFRQQESETELPQITDIDAWFSCPWVEDQDGESRNEKKKQECFSEDKNKDVDEVHESLSDEKDEDVDQMDVEFGDEMDEVLYLQMEEDMNDEMDEEMNDDEMEDMNEEMNEEFLRSMLE